MSYHLKLIGPNSYNTRTHGLVLKGFTITVRDADEADRLLEKGTYSEDGFHRPFFEQVDTPIRPEVVKRQSRVKEGKVGEGRATGPKRVSRRPDTNLADTALKAGNAKPAAPVGSGPNGAENENDLIEDEGLVGKDPLYDTSLAELEAARKRLAGGQDEPALATKDSVESLDEEEGQDEEQEEEQQEEQQEEEEAPAPAPASRAAQRTRAAKPATKAK